MRCSTDEFRLKLRKTVFVDYRNYETRFAMRSDDALASAFVASALPGFRASRRGPARMPHFCQSDQKQAESTGVFGPQVQHLSKRGVFAKIWILPKGDFRATNGFWRVIVRRVPQNAADAAVDTPGSKRLPPP